MEFRVGPRNVCAVRRSRQGRRRRGGKRRWSAAMRIQSLDPAPQDGREKEKRVANSTKTTRIRVFTSYNYCFLQHLASIT
eukprot:3143073-Pyramimonas_sp.AAC.1